MKKYLIIVFLLFLTMGMKAPEANKKVFSNLIHTEKIDIKDYNAELYDDSIDVVHIKKLKMITTFKKQERKEVKRIAKKYSIPTKWLYDVFFIECRGNIYKPNPRSGAIGLIQFLPSTAKSLGTSTDSLKQMTVLQQLYYVDKYFSYYFNENKKPKRKLDLYLSIFHPISIGKKDSHIIGDYESRIVKQNREMDINNDSILTVEEIRFVLKVTNI